MGRYGGYGGWTNHPVDKIGKFIVRTIMLLSLVVFVLAMLFG